MSLSGNFTSVVLEQGKLTVSGHNGDLPGSELLSVSVVIVQNGHVARGTASVGEVTWMTETPLDARDFASGVEALGVGCETFVTVPGDDAPGTVPSFTTFTWAQRVNVV
jgi:hypothetical protein